MLSMMSCRLTKEKLPTVSKSIVKDSTIVVSHDTVMIHSIHDTIIDNKEIFLSIMSKQKGFDVLYHIKPIQIEIPVYHNEIEPSRQSLRYEYRLNKLKLKNARKQIVRDINSNLKIQKDSIKETHKTNRVAIRNKPNSKSSNIRTRFVDLMVNVVAFILGFLFSKVIDIYKRMPFTK